MSPCRTFGLQHHAHGFRSLSAPKNNPVNNGFYHEHNNIWGNDALQACEVFNTHNVNSCEEAGLDRRLSRRWCRDRIAWNCLLQNCLNNLLGNRCTKCRYLVNSPVMQKTINQRYDVRKHWMLYIFNQTDSPNYSDFLVNMQNSSVHTKQLYIKVPIYIPNLKTDSLKI